MTGALGQLSVRQYGPSHGSHAHDHFQVLLGLEGTLELEVEGRGQRVLAGLGCVIAPGERHDFEAQGHARCLVLDTSAPEWTRAGSSPAHPNTAQALAHYLHAALDINDSLAQHCGPLLLLNCWLPSASPAGPSHRQRRQIDWQRFTQWCESQMHHPLTVADLAAHVFLSPTQFAVRCQQETRLRPMQWVRMLRLQRALTLRAEGWAWDLIAPQCGYRSASALSTALRQQRLH